MRDGDELRILECMVIAWNGYCLSARKILSVTHKDGGFLATLVKETAQHMVVQPAPDV